MAVTRVIIEVKVDGKGLLKPRDLLVKKNWEKPKYIGPHADEGVEVTLVKVHD